MILLFTGFALLLFAYILVWVRAGSNAKKKVVKPYYSPIHTLRHANVYYKELTLYVAGFILIGVYVTNFEYGKEDVKEITTPTLREDIVFDSRNLENTKLNEFGVDMPDYFKPRSYIKRGDDRFITDNGYITYIREGYDILGIDNNGTVIMFSDYNIPSFNTLYGDFELANDAERAEWINKIIKYVNNEETPVISYSRDYILERFSFNRPQTLEDTREEVFTPLSRTFFGLSLGEDMEKAIKTADSLYERDGVKFKDNRGRNIELMGNTVLNGLRVGIKLSSKQEFDVLRNHLMDLYDYRGSIGGGLHYVANVDERNVEILLNSRQVKDGIDINIEYILPN